MVEMPKDNVLVGEGQERKLLCMRLGSSAKAACVCLQIFLGEGNCGDRRDIEVFECRWDHQIQYQNSLRCL